MKPTPNLLQKNLPRSLPRSDKNGNPILFVGRLVPIVALGDSWIHDGRIVPRPPFFVRVSRVVKSIQKVDRQRRLIPKGLGSMPVGAWNPDHLYPLPASNDL